MFLVLLLLTLGSILQAGSPPSEFAQHVLATDFKGGTQVVVADLNRDGKPDIIAVSAGMNELIWFENPGWKRHVLADLTRPSNVAVWDIDGDGIPEIVVAHEFSDQVETSLGILSVLTHGNDPRQPWKMTEFDRIPTSHRLRWADLSGDGRKRLINAPLSGLKEGKTPVVSYKPGLWMRETISDENPGFLRDIHITDWDGAGHGSILTASSGGIHLLHLGKDGTWNRSDVAAPPFGGTDRIATGSLGMKMAPVRFIAALEPSPGSQVSIYREDNKGKWLRQILDDSLSSAGALLTADLNGDGNDEIIAGDQGGGRNLSIYYANSHRGERWAKTTLDAGGIGAADCAAADLNADGRSDIVCIGSGPVTLTWYENKGPRK